MTFLLCLPDLLNDLSITAGNFHVSQGFICDPSDKRWVSKQCDILVYDKNHYPVVYADGSIKVVWPKFGCHGYRGEDHSCQKGCRVSARKHYFGKTAEYESIRSGKADRGAVVVAFLLYLFFQVMQIGRNEADFINALNDMFEKYTEKKWRDIDIGLPPDPSVVEN